VLQATEKARSCWGRLILPLPSERRVAEGEREIPEGDDNLCVSQASSVDTDLSYVTYHVAPSDAKASAAVGVETRCARSVTVVDSTCDVERGWSAAPEYKPAAGCALGDE
jgi:hypothetical protein